MKKLSLLLLLVGFLIFNTVEAFQPFVVKNIRVRGLHRVSEAAVLNELPIQIGQSIDETQASEAIRALYQSGFFTDVSLSRDNDTLVIRVVERSAVSKLTLNGIKDKDKILKTLREAGVAEGRMYDPTLLAAAVRELEKHYFKKGKYGVKIESHAVEEAPSMMHVTIDIYEGDIAKIKQIRIVGNQSYSESDLVKDFLSSKTTILSWFSKNDLYVKEKLYADLETLRSFYMDRGFIHFQIDSTQVSLTPDKKYIYITIHITEGDRYAFGQPTLTGKFVVPESGLVALLKPICIGKTFSRKTILEVKQTLEDAMGNVGYAQAEARVDPRIDEKNKVVNVHYELIPGRRVYVRRIGFTGNLTTIDEVLRRELPQMEGTWVSTCLISEGKAKILRRGYASEIEVETVPVPGSPDQVDVIYKIEEARLGQVGGGIGYSGTEKVMLNFNISQENFFGTGKLVEFNIDKSRSQSTYALNYMDPYFTIDGIGMGASVYYSKVDLRKATAVSDYITDNCGTEFRLVFPLGKYESISTSLGYDNTHLKVHRYDEAQEIRDFIRRYGKNFNEYLAGIGWGYDSLDERIFPHKGLHQALRLRVSTPGSNIPYYKLTYEGEMFYPLDDCERWIINLGTSLGYGEAFGKQKTKHGLHSSNRLPFFRHFYAGGMRTARGYEENSLGPPDTPPPGFGRRAFGGNVLVAGRFNFIFPNPIKPDIKCIRTSVFIDAAQIYDTHFYDRFLNGTKRVGNHSGLRYSAGISLTWHSPIGAPITVCLGFPLNARKGDHKRVFNFWMGAQY